MLYTYFKSNQPIVLFLLPFVLLACWLWGFFHPLPEAVENVSPVYGMLLGPVLEIPWLSRMVALLLIVIEAILLSRLFNNYDFLQRETYLTAILFALLAGFHFQFQVLNPVLVANLFLILFLRRLLAIYQQKRVFSQVFDSGLFLGLACLFYQPLVFLFPLIWMALLFSRAINWREWLIPVLGFALPIVFTAVYYYWNDRLGELPALLLPRASTPREPLTDSLFLNLVNGGVLALLWVFAFGEGFRSLRSSSVRSRTTKQLMFFLLILTFVAFLLSAWWPYSEYRFVLFALPGGTFFAFLLQGARAQWMAATAFYALIVLYFVNYYFEFVL